METARAKQNEGEIAGARKRCASDQQNRMEYVQTRRDATNVCEVKVAILSPLPSWPAINASAANAGGKHARAIACSRKDDDVCVIISLFLAARCTRSPRLAQLRRCIYNDAKFTANYDPVPRWGNIS